MPTMVDFNILNRLITTHQVLTDRFKQTKKDNPHGIQKTRIINETLRQCGIIHRKRARAYRDALVGWLKQTRRELQLYPS